MLWESLFGKSPLRIEPRQAALWSETEVEGGTKHEGFFTVFAVGGKVRLQVRGSVVARRGRAAEVLLHDPPASLKQHRHGPCFQLWRPNTLWFKLHWEVPAFTFEASRAYVEQILEECLLGSESTWQKT